MPLNVAVYVMPGHRRSQMCCNAMLAGINRTGDRAALIPFQEYRSPEHDACVFYGYVPDLQKIMADYNAAGRPAVYIDLGYWKREGLTGYHKIAIGARHPTAYFQRRKHDDSRVKALGVSIAPWRKRGKHILLAGMGAKASVIAEHLEFESFERDALAMITQYSNRQVVYRPKPSCKNSRPLPGTVYSPKEQDLARVLRDCHAVVTHHSNVAVDALVAGVPVFCWHGVAAPLGSQDLTKIKTPQYPDNRAQWLNDVSYTQFSVPEMAQGVAWRHLKDEGLL